MYAGSGNRITIKRKTDTNSVSSSNNLDSSMVSDKMSLQHQQQQPVVISSQYQGINPIPQQQQQLQQKPSNNLTLYQNASMVSGTYAVAASQMVKLQQLDDPSAAGSHQLMQSATNPMVQTNFKRPPASKVYHSDVTLCVQTCLTCVCVSFRCLPNGKGAGVAMPL